MELFAADGHDAGGCERVTGKSGMRPTRLAPQIRQFVQVRQALVGAEAQSATVTALLETPRIGVVHLDRRGRILAVNDRALSLLRQGEWLSDEDGVL